jgi:membrane protease YdiL (CAAX protease family)
VAEGSIPTQIPSETLPVSVSPESGPVSEQRYNNPYAPPAAVVLDVAGDKLSAGQRRALAIIEVLLCSSVPTQLSILGLMQATGWGLATEPSLSAIAFLGAADTTLLIAMMIVITRAHGQSLKELWLGHRRPMGEARLGLLLVIPVFMIVGLVMAALMQFAPSLHNVPVNPFEELANGGVRDAVMLGVVAILAGGVREELQRAFLLQRFERHLGGPIVGVIILSLAFGLGHYPQGWDATITTGLLGAFWAIVYLRRRSVVAPMVSHAMFNAIQVASVALISR